MHKIFFKVAFVAAVAMVAGINVFNAQKTELMSDIAMENVEALANNEIKEGKWTVTIYTVDHWKCTDGGGVCCPDIDC